MDLQNWRPPTLQEEKLLEFLVEKSRLTISPNWKEGLTVCSMNDGMMGSLHLLPRGIIESGRCFGKQVSSFQYIDEDGVDVLVALNVDIEGKLFELDIWKTNFHKLRMLPKL